MLLMATQMFFKEIFNLSLLHSNTNYLILFTITEVRLLVRQTFYCKNVSTKTLHSVENFVNVTLHSVKTFAVEWNCCLTQDEFKFMHIKESNLSDRLFPDEVFVIQRKKFHLWLKKNFIYRRNLCKFHCYP